MPASETIVTACSSARRSAVSSAFVGVVTHYGVIQVRAAWYEGCPDFEGMVCEFLAAQPTVGWMQ
jgi:hypothetical protein